MQGKWNKRSGRERACWLRELSWPLLGDGGAGQKSNRTQDPESLAVALRTGCSGAWGRGLLRGPEGKGIQGGRSAHGELVRLQVDSESRGDKIGAQVSVRRREQQVR